MLNKANFASLRVNEVIKNLKFLLNIMFKYKLKKAEIVDHFYFFVFML